MANTYQVQQGMENILSKLGDLGKKVGSLASGVAWRSQNKAQKE